MSLFELPGPRAWFVPIAEAIERRTVVISCHPSPDMPDGLGDAVRRTAEERRPILHHRSVPADLPAVASAIDNAELVARSVASHLHLDVPPGQRYGPADLLSDEHTDECVLHIDARGESERVQATWMGFAEVCAAASKELPVSERPAVVVHVLGNATSHLPQRDTNLRVLWWWGALGPLDIAVALYGRTDDQVQLACIIEVARWDVALATSLADRWDGDPGRLPDLIPPVSGSAVIGHGADASSAPGPALDDWMAGTAESWNGRVDHHQGLRPADLSQRVWNAQLQVVYPWLEEVRAKVAADVAAEAARANGDGLSPSDLIDELSVAEWGRLKHLTLVELRLPVPHATTDLIRRAVRARNSLAHLTPISLDDLRGLRRARRAAGY